MKYRGYTCIPKYSEADNGYCGVIQGLNEAGEITAPTIDDFIRIYHQTVDDFLDVKGRTKVKKKGRALGISILILIILIAIAAVTCPDRDKHVTLITDRMSSTLSNEPKDGNGDYWDNMFYKAEKEMIRPGVDKYLVVKDYFLVSVGKWSTDTGEYPLSLGIFGHVYSFSEEWYRQRAEEGKHNN